MSADLIFTRSGELEVTEVAGWTVAGVDFVDEVIVAVLNVVDAGRILIPTSSVEDVERQAREQGLTIKHEIVESERPS